MIQTVDLCKTYKNGLEALHNINLSIEPGEFVFLTGESGAGKSTLIKLLFREQQPTSGFIMISGKNINRLGRKDVVRLRRNTGVVFQDFRLMENSNVFDNVAFALKAVERPWEEIKTRVPEVLEWVGLAGREKENVMHLSGGEQQRVAVARAIINDPLILFADEPTGDLDPNTSAELMKLFEQINAAGTTVVMATHDQDIVEKMQKRVITLRKGRLVNDAIGGFSL
ncbi:MAG: cell division ATP-binding protein FtsE [Firmicutes bacterium]|nr:cell division ATP-binding protein FtsE [Bacillota bacterium]MBQ3112504.1 cell division ATP-binding protein FtsE [Bacillota bacterium]MBQ6842351.1 cell division ATP-binding protein FtsE [Bacillota bacterium]MBR6823984.1 cell division ATP-binding protein FtsE [Bacillota bacterium]MBR7113254.1 cell division ATP-binding protein FtsE [Bacillota bacterium]